MFIPSAEYVKRKDDAAQLAGAARFVYRAAHSN